MSNKRRKKHTPGRKRKKALSKIWIISVVVAVILIAVIAIAAAYIRKMEKSGSGEPDSVGETGERITFPYELADGKLKAASLFQYSGLNPDCNNEEGEDIAALEIVNQSNEFCKSAEIHVRMEDGTELVFRAEDIPAGRKIWVFESGNQSVGQDDVCEEIRDNSEFEEVALMENQIMASVEDTTITIENLTGEEITDLMVGCHCLFEDTYFGGVTYSYPTGTIPAGGQAVVDAADCYMGTAEVVWISNNEE
ncbi:MAG: hypothetical protein U0N27_07225 [Massilistercora timonensis]